MIRGPDDILREVILWREEGYPSISEISKVTERLLNYWFVEEHTYEEGGSFKFWDCQQEAFETLIYLYSIKKQHTISDIRDEHIETNWGDWTKYAFQMATGSGKTFVMAMVIVWQYFLKLKEKESNATTNFLLIAPNTIVLDRLIYGFEGGGVFQEFPFFIPEEWRSEFNFQVISQSSGETKHAHAILHITNRHQFHKKQGATKPENPIKKVLQYLGGPKPTSGEEFKDRIDLNELMLRYDKIVVLNDEAHHAHPGTQWFKAIEKLSKHDKILLQLDFTATTIHDGRIFPHLVYNYPLKRAVEDKIVKTPLIITLEKDRIKTNDYMTDYAPIIELAHKIYQKKKKEFELINKKPVLFVLCDNNNNADTVGRKIANDYGYGNKVLVIHTLTRKTSQGVKGDIVQKDLDKARKVAREIDSNEIEVIVSVLMLTEGWDVKNVVVILPMRAFTSDILTEQTLGRGLRRMFPPKSEVDDILYVVDHPSFIKNWEEQMKAGELPKLDITRTYLPPTWVMPNEEKYHYDIIIPIVRGGLIDISPDLENFNIEDLPKQQRSIGSFRTPQGNVIAINLFLGKQEELKDITLDYFFKLPQTYFSFLTKRILNISAASQSQFSILYPKVRDYVLYKYFKESIDISDEKTFKKLHNNEVMKDILENFIHYINEEMSLTYDKQPSLTELHIKKFRPFQTTHKVYSSKKSVFDEVPYDSEPEKDFMMYLDNREEVRAYTRIFWKLPVYITYYDRKKKTIRKYRPDFIVEAERESDITHFLVEIKGEYYDQQESVKYKTQAGKKWCETVSALTGNKWVYVKIMEDDLKKYKTKELFEMVRLINRKTA
ncbi:hypothetical protein LCGC14_1441870 [marine sediment metagenome]|uniref:Uncharacterized protein n=1 Tax=marine sediment metagenome TaxID=412755 RepID=A0A0F9JKG3_9ZZZZ